MFRQIMPVEFTYTIKGADKISGSERTARIDATSPEDATARANMMGILVSNVQRHEPSHQERQTEYLQRIAFWITLWSVIVCVLITISVCGGILSILTAIER
jgi:hypothetical protein